MQVRAINVTHDRDKRTIVRRIDMSDMGALVSRDDASAVADLWLRGAVEVGAIPYRERYEGRMIG